MSLEDHPGYFGITSRGVIAIHADWPMYPFEHGWKEALLAFGSLPSETRFFQVDDIDKCFLFSAGRMPTAQDKLDPRISYVSAWHEDMVELTQNGYVEGITLITEYEAALAYWQKHKHLYHEREPGVLVSVNLPKPEPEEDGLFETESVPVIDPAGIAVTEAGRVALRSFLSEEFSHAKPDFRERIDPILGINRTDAAVREGCVLLESLMRQSLGSAQFGQNLIEEFCARLLERGGIPALVKPFKAQLKNAFRYIRNDYMHNVRSLELDEGKALLTRIARLYSIVRTEFGE